MLQHMNMSSGGDQRSRWLSWALFHHYGNYNHPEPSCSLDTIGDQTPGRELVMDSGSQQAACLGLWTQLDQQVVYEVPAYGDYFMMLDSTWHKMDGRFEIFVDVNGD